MSPRSHNKKGEERERGGKRGKNMRVVCCLDHPNKTAAQPEGKVIGK